MSSIQPKSPSPPPPPVPIQLPNNTNHMAITNNNQRSSTSASSSSSSSSSNPTQNQQFQYTDSADIGAGIHTNHPQHHHSSSSSFSYTATAHLTEEPGPPPIIQADFGVVDEETGQTLIQGEILIPTSSSNSNNNNNEIPLPGITTTTPTVPSTNNSLADFLTAITTISKEPTLTTQNSVGWFLTFMFCFILLALVTSIAQLIFGIMAFVIGVDSYKSDQQECEHTIALWLVVFGTLILFGCIFGCCCRPKPQIHLERVTDNSNHHHHHLRGRIVATSNQKRLWLYRIPGIVISLVVFAWLIFGVVIVYRGNNKNGTKQWNDHEPCPQDLFHHFQIIVLFLFWSGVVMASFGILAACALAPTIIGIANMVEHAKQQRILVNAATAAADAAANEGTNSLLTQPLLVEGDTGVVGVVESAM
jgi:hypothetical protein